MASRVVVRRLMSTSTAVLGIKSPSSSVFLPHDAINTSEQKVLEEKKKSCELFSFVISVCYQ